MNPKNTKKQIKERLVPMAVAFLKKYAGEPEFLAYCVKDEPVPATLPKLQFYYNELKKEVPDVKLYLINKMTASARKQQAPYPNILGHDSYPFAWGWNTYGYTGLVRPDLALRWFRRRCVVFGKECRKRSIPMVTVFTGQPVWEEIIDFSRTKSKRRLKACSDYKKILIRQFVKEKRAGWISNKAGTRYIHPQWYRAPKNCMRAMAWIAVMEGSKMLFHWSWAKDIKMPEEKMFKKSFYLRINDEQFEEYAGACRTFRKYEKIIMNMQKLDDSVLKDSNKFLYHSTNRYSADSKILTLVNTDVGTWKRGKRKSLKKGMGVGEFLSGRLQTNSNGDLLGYTAKKDKKIFVFKINSENQKEQLWDILGDRVMTKSADGEYSISITPGGGKFVFMGTQNNYNKLKSHLKGK